VLVVVCDLRPLEAVCRVAAEYGLPQGELKPCVAVLLDGSFGPSRHEAAFLIALELRRIGLSEQRAGRVIGRWARKYGVSRSHTAIRSAWEKNANGDWRYRAPGLAKRPGTVAFKVLLPVCVEIGCPQQCPPLAGRVRRGPARETYERFQRLGWPSYLRKSRHDAATDFYRAVCEVERARGFAPGTRLHVSYRQLAELADRNFAHAPESLELLLDLDLLTMFERGSGSGPNARDRKASTVQRRVPIPNTPVSPHRNRGSRGATCMGRLGQRP
jgi:hypothetical protein